MIYQTPTGMKDLFENDFYFLDKIEKVCSGIANFYNFKKIEPPLLEDSEIYEKGTGEFTDIVEKEMYTLRTKGGKKLTIRPEFTPSIVRAYIEHGMQSKPKPVKLWYLGPCFRHERPQAGRLRQFHQFGFEALGVQDPVIDALLIKMAYSALEELGLKNLIVEVNTLGDKQCKPYFKKALLGYFRNKVSGMCPDCKRRLKTNPLRLLDCKEEKCQRIVKSAPQMVDYFCEECHGHFKELLEFFEELEMPYNLNPYLVRGLDYYTKTVFEIFEDTEKGRAQGALCGGGRYDGLVKLLGGKDTPACGFAGGCERIINILKESQAGHSQPKKNNKIFLAQIGELAKRKGLKLLEDLRKARVRVADTLHKDSLALQLKIADQMGAKYVLILGQKEALENKIILKQMKTGKQTILDLNKTAKDLARKKL